MTCVPNEQRCPQLGNRRSLRCSSNPAWTRSSGLAAQRPSQPSAQLVGGLWRQCCRSGPRDLILGVWQPFGRQTGQAPGALGKNGHIRTRHASVPPSALDSSNTYCLTQGSVSRERSLTCNVLHRACPMHQDKGLPLFALHVVDNGASALCGT